MKILYSVTDREGNTINKKFLRSVELNPCNVLDQSRIQAVKEICRTAIYHHVVDVCPGFGVEDVEIDIDSIVFED
jgi:hypothetical protein